MAMPEFSEPSGRDIGNQPASGRLPEDAHPRDRLTVCAPEEMKRRLQRLPSIRSSADSLQDGSDSQVDLALQDEKNYSAPGQVLMFEDYSGQKPAEEDSPNQDLPSENLTLAQPSQGENPAELPMKNIERPRNWLWRLLFPDPPEPRKSPRESLPGLAAHFWTGGAPQVQGIREISLTGLFVLTGERWYPGTVVRMTLTDCRQPTAEHSITLNASVMRSDNDGVGFRFVMQNEKDTRQGKYPPASGMEQCANARQLEQFILRYRSGNE